MYQFFETIKIVDGIIQNFAYHQKRVNESVLHSCKKENFHILRDILTVPDNLKSGVVKCNFFFNENDFMVKYEKYELRNIKTLKLVNGDNIDYNYKYYDRTEIDDLYKQRNDCDDILIVKNNKITDTSISNIVLFDGAKWITPDSYLLNGTCRQRLLEQNRIEAKPVYIDDIFHYNSLVLINAMRGDDFENVINISSIK
ncbi:MAG TPA: aminotransferase class IV [Bacteroidales bacterium]|nr:aminotransferase class IV [Bacteroidales bacterium]